MANSVSGQDVEDMLSSVRRLVSNELPPHRRVSRTQEAEKLVLTDAQRVEPAKSRPASRNTRLEDRIAELEAAVSKTPDDWEPDGSEDQDQHRPDRIVYTPPEGARRTTRRTSRITLLDTEAKTGEAEDGSAERLSPIEVEAVAREAVSKTVRHDSAFDAALDKAVTESLGKAAAPRAPVPEPEVEAVAETAPEPVAAPTPEPVAEAAPTIEPEPQPEATAPPLTLDAETLRPIVSKLLREELQGEIGERITRNVRKLVRQEIQRALSVQDLE